MKFTAWFLLCALAAAGSAAASNHPVIERIEQPEQPGKKPAILLQRGINVREAIEGDEVHPAERVRTDAQTKVTLKYVDGSLLEVGPNSDLEIERIKKGILSSQLLGGYVKGEVQKLPAAVAGAKPRIHFLIRTKAAVMGVRGTQFVAALDAIKGIAEFHTLEGTVEVGKTAESLIAAQGGLPVSGGQFVAATADGFSGVQAFNPAGFLQTLGSSGGLQTVSAAASTTSSAISSGAASAAGTAAGATKSNGPPPSAPPSPPPALAPPPAPPKSAEQEAKEKLAQEEEDKLAPRIHFANFQVAFVYAEEPSVPGLDKVRHRALQLAYTPYFPLPILKFIYVRPFLGATVLEDGSLNNGVLTREAQVFVGVSLLRPLFVEAGLGIQNWAKLSRDAAQVSLNAGLILNENKFFNRLFIGATGAHFGDQKGSLSDAQWVGEIRGGLGFQF